MFLERLGALDAPQRHEEESQEGGAQTEKRRSQTPVDLLRALEDAAPHQGRHRQEYAGPWYRVRRAKKRRRVVEQTEAGQ